VRNDAEPHPELARYNVKSPKSTAFGRQAAMKMEDANSKVAGIERKPKNSHGAGTYRERDGKIQAQVVIDGRRVSRTFATKREAQKWVRTTLTDADRGIVPTKADVTTVAAYLSDWLASATPSTFLAQRLDTK
jgi:hypothetical protein